jgi:hypothetical protein
MKKKDRRDHIVAEALEDSRHGSGTALATIFATQLGGMGQNGLVRRRNSERVLGPKILTEWHAIELGGIAEAEFADRCVTTPPRGLSVVLIWG